MLSRWNQLTWVVLDKPDFYFLPVAADARNRCPPRANPAHVCSLWLGFLPCYIITTNATPWMSSLSTKVSFFGQCSKMQLIPLQNFIIKTCFIQFLWFFRLKCWFKGQIISRIHLSLPNAYKLMCFDRNINGNRDDNFFEWDYWSLHWWKNLTLLT